MKTELYNKIINSMFYENTLKEIRIISSTHMDRNQDDVLLVTDDPAEYAGALKKFLDIHIMRKQNENDATPRFFCAILVNGDNDYNVVNLGYGVHSRTILNCYYGNYHINDKKLLSSDVSLVPTEGGIDYDAVYSQKLGCFTIFSESAMKLLNWKNAIVDAGMYREHLFDEIEDDVFEMFEENIQGCKWVQSMISTAQRKYNSLKNTKNLYCIVDRDMIRSAVQKKGIKYELYLTECISSPKEAVNAFVDKYFKFVKNDINSQVESYFAV